MMRQCKCHVQYQFIDKTMAGFLKCPLMRYSLYTTRQFIYLDTVNMKTQKALFCHYKPFKGSFLRIYVRFVRR